MSSDESDVVICRACIEECNEYKNIYRQGVILGEVTTLAAMLSYCTNFEFEEHEDFLPSNMCIICIQTLGKLYSFKQTVERSNDILRNQHIELQNIPTEEEEWQEMANDDNVHHQQKQELGVASNDILSLTDIVKDQQKQEDLAHNAYVTLTVIDDLTNDNDDDMKVEREIEEVIESKEEEVIYDDEETEQDNHFKEEADYDTEYEITFHAEENSVVAQSGSTSEEIEYDIEQDKIAIDTSKLTQNKMISQHPTMAFRQIRAVKTRLKGSGNKPININLQCQVCGKQLSNANSFRYHMQLHSDATPFLCSECGAGFKTRNAYEGHMSIHDPNNPNTCEICGKSYRQPSSLRSHMLTHTGEKPFQCDICGKGMTQKSGYKKHMLVHTGEKPHSCNICGRQFRYSSNLIAHKRYHTGDKPYDCALCEKCFPTSEQLKRHTLVHTGERPFGCDLCEKRFNRRSALSAHRQTHTKMAGDSELECPEQTSKNVAVTEK